MQAPQWTNEKDRKKHAAEGCWIERNGGVRRKGQNIITIFSSSNACRHAKSARCTCFPCTKLNNVNTENVRFYAICVLYCVWMWGLLYLFIKFDGYAACEINWNDIYCSNNRSNKQWHTAEELGGGGGENDAISMMTINKWRWQGLHFHIWPISKYKIPLISSPRFIFYLLHFIMCLRNMLLNRSHLTWELSREKEIGWSNCCGKSIENRDRTRMSSLE